MSGSRHRPLVGLHYFATDQSLPITDFARAAAERGFDAVLLPEHTHIPVSTVAPYPGDLPERYRRTLDLQAVEGDVVAVLDRYAAVLAKL
jgi:alkanesulfonate monooxygenase SsuD/methylene tetrahydromethanopterin reductase-like flavin-dependent oxidoreductase (luciferase family)